ncbi:5,6-dimethylbenzimidazole synthase [Sphingomonas mollis]|uniref:5,6-dimethylbenzimidazole synthase n=1 Tax=Sphingomonas mollis TaxID=2795726 RepID=A0ABS0XPS6_9SPHN|nr:5,6-dimethylbenzimidazole synthase [Sphingomonas sp. BT553]MBJ6121728.1 5,6-dimethylbenzimidazole synthase [Sphingomonas sp. BT553]
MTPPVFDAAFAEQLTQLIRWRRDVRHFDRRPLAPTDLQWLFETAALAPSVGHSQPWRFVRIRSVGLREALAAHVDTASTAAAASIADADRRARYAGLKLHGLREAPEIVAVFCDDDPVAGHGLGRATMAETLRYSTVMAIHTLWLVARSRGIGVGWVSILDPDTVTAMLTTPSGWSLVALLCIGYPTAPAAEPELEHRQWQAREAPRIVER